MNYRSKSWLKVALTVLFVAAEAFALSFTIPAEFDKPSVRHLVRAFGTQACFVLALLFLWLGERPRISWDAGWGALGLAILLFHLL